MRFLLHMARAYPSATLITLVALLLAGLIQGISLSALLPVVSVAMNAGDASAAGSDNPLVGLLASLGITPSLGVLLSVLVFGLSMKAVVVLLANRHVGYTVARIATDLRLNLLRALLETRWDYYLHQPIGSLTNAMATEAVRGSLAYLNGARTAAALVEALVYVTVALLVSWQAALAAITVAGLISGGFGFLVRISRRAGNRQTRLLSSLMSRMTDTLQSVKALKSMGLADRANVVLEAETGRLNKAMRREVISSEALKALYEPAMIAFVAGGLFVAVTYFSLPLASLLVLVVLLVRVLASLSKVQRSYQGMVAKESAYWSLFKTIQSAEQAPEAADAGEPPDLQREIRLEQIRFAFGSKRVLAGLSLQVPAGSFTTIIGPSGSGKTTVVDLITGLLKPDSGEVRIDDVPLPDCNLQQWRHMIGYVPQETLLLHDTVLHNVTLGDPTLTEADTERALRAAGAWDFISATPEGLQSVVGERGGKLSGGQRQRLCIARALVRNPKLLILDEATSALDPDSEAQICDTLGKLRGQITVLAISHQSGLTRIADRVLRLEEGVLVDAGREG
jgi:ATP-binding cassette subfamily C protein